MCDTLVVVQDGRVLFAKNSDRDANEAQVLEWHPAQRHDAAARLRCTWIEIPQVAETHAVLISRPFWMWGAEMGANEHGVLIGNEAVFTNQHYAASGLTGMDLLRLALERAATAADAVAVITDLIDRHGQGGGCGHEDRSFTYHNSFLIADPTGAAVLETAGQRWAVEEVAAGVRTISNGLTIPGFAARYSDRTRTAVSSCRVRQPFTTRAAASDPSPAGLMALLRSHGRTRWPRYSPVNGAMSGPCMHATGFLAGAQTTASWVSELTPGEWLHWVTATAAPCTSLFKPVGVDEPLDLGPPPVDRYDGESLWWRHERLHRAALKDPASVRFLAERDELERHWLSARPPAAEAFALGDELLRRWTASLAPAGDVRPWWVRRYWHERDRRADLPAVSLPNSATAPVRSLQRTPIDRR